MSLSRRDERRVRDLKQALAFAQTELPNRRQSMYRMTIQAAVREMIYDRLKAAMEANLRKLAATRGTGRQA